MGGLARGGDRGGGVVTSLIITIRNSNGELVHDTSDHAALAPGRYVIYCMVGGKQVACEEMEIAEQAEHHEAGIAGAAG